MNTASTARPLSGQVFEPDYLILATGSSYPFPAKTEEPDIASARRLRTAHEALLAADRALVLCAGPAGLELAGEIKTFFPDKQVTLADISEDIPAGPYDQPLRDELRRQLDGLGVELRLDAPRPRECRTHAKVEGFESLQTLPGTEYLNV